MDVLPKALPEKFFIDATDECLVNLSRLVDVGVASCMLDYLGAADGNSAVKQRIEDALGDAIKLATFHTELHTRGTVSTVRNLNLDAIAAMTSVAQMQEMVESIEFINSNRRYIRSNIKPRTKDDYMQFLSSVPSEYKQGVSVNRDYFYDPKAKEIPTGLGVIVRRQQELEIALKGLRYRIAMYTQHSDPSQFFSKV